MSEQKARMFWESYVLHHELLEGELSDKGVVSPTRWEEISERNRAALILAFDTLTALETP